MSTENYVWLVTGTCGEYSDYCQWSVGAFLTEAAAQKYADAAIVEASKYPSNGTYNERSEFKTSLDPQFRYDYTGTNYHVEMVKLHQL